MGSPFLDAFLAYWRKKVKSDADKKKPTIDKIDRTRRFDFAQSIPRLLGYIFHGSIESEESVGTPILNPGDWSAYLIHRADGTLFNIENMDFWRGVDHLSSGRLVAVWTSEKQTDFSFHYCEQHSDDGGETWSAIDSLNVSTTTPPLGRDFTRYGGILEVNSKIMVYTRGLVGTGGDPPARKIYKSVWDSGWTGPTLWHSEAGQNLSTVRPMRSRDRSVAGVLYLKALVAPPNTQRFFYAPLDASGEATAHEAVTDTTDPLELAVSPVLAYTEDNKPVAIFLYEPANEVWYKIRNGSWPASFTKVSAGDLDAPTEPFVLEVASSAALPKWGGGAWLSNGNLHALRDDASAQDAKFVHRRRLAGVWSVVDPVDFLSVGSSLPPFSGTGSAWYSGEHIMGRYPRSDGKPFGVIWMTATGFVNPMTLWYVRYNK